MIESNRRDLYRFFARDWTMQNKIPPRMIGIIFLTFGLVLGFPSLFSGTFEGGMMGFCTFAVLFGLVMLFVPVPKQGL
jgi:hypothetical protein